MLYTTSRTADLITFAKKQPRAHTWASKIEESWSHWTQFTTLLGLNAGQRIEQGIESLLRIPKIQVRTTLLKNIQ